MPRPSSAMTTNSLNLDLCDFVLQLAKMEAARRSAAARGW